MIQLNRLEGFFWVARTGGYSKAARAFPYPITQPAVHQQVKKLESEVGVSLFERVGKDRIVLTPAGKQLYEFVAPFFGGLQALLRSLRAGDYGGELRIHAGALFVRHLLPAWLRRLRKARPGLTLDLREHQDLTCAPLESGEADLVVSHLPEVPAGIDTRQVAVLHPFLVLPAAHPLARRKRIGVRDLRGETFIGYSPGSIIHRLQMDELALHDVRPRNLITTQSIDSILGFVESGLGFSLVPSFHEDGPQIKGIAARRIGGRRRVYPVHAAWRRSAGASPHIRAALEAAPTVG